MSLPAASSIQSDARQPRPIPGTMPDHRQPPFLRQALECLLAGIVAGLASTLALMAVVMLLSALARAEGADDGLPRIASPANAEGGCRRCPVLGPAITATALEHHLVCRFTSLVAVDKTPVRTLDQALKTQLPAGWEYGQVFGRMPQTATPTALYLLLGTLMLLAGLFLRRRLPA